MCHPVVELLCSMNKALCLVPSRAKKNPLKMFTYVVFQSFYVFMYFSTFKRVSF